MTESVGRDEFNILVKRVDKIEEHTEKNEELLIKVDKKTDIILEKVANADNTKKLENQTVDLKLAPIIKRVDEIEDNQRYVRRQLLGTAITVIITLIGLIIALVKLWKG
jgi:hypothetical protein